VWEKQRIQSTTRPSFETGNKEDDSDDKPLPTEIDCRTKRPVSKVGDVRRKLWHELIRIEDTTGHGLSKAVSKLYATWLRTVRLNQDATLEVDEDDSSVIEWGGIRINLPQLRNWVVFQIGKFPREHRVALIRCCKQILSFNDLQAAELCRQLFHDSHSARRFMKLFRKTPMTGVMGWRPLIMALRAAVDRWSVAEMKRPLKGFFDPDEYAILWLRLSKFADTKDQLESRLRAQEDGIRLPRGDQKEYIKWLKNTHEASEFAKMMIALQRTQELDINEWREIQEQVYERFGKEIYKKLLQERDESISEILKGSIPEFYRKRVAFGALKEEQDELTPEWEKRLPEIYEALRSGRDQTEILEDLLHQSESEKKMKRVRKTIRRADEEWFSAIEQVKESDDNWGLLRCFLSEEIRNRWGQAVKVLDEQLECALNIDPIRGGMKALPGSSAQ
jgi:hypothetical protein